MYVGDLVDEIARYERRCSRGAVTAGEHEALCELVSRRLGSVAVAFFNQERTLPLATRGLPWPMKQHKGHTFRVVRLTLTFVFCLAAVFEFPVSDLGGALAVTAAAVAFFWGMTLVMMLFRPRDIDERHRLVREYLQMRIAYEIERGPSARHATRVSADSEFDRIIREEFKDHPNA